MVADATRPIAAGLKRYVEDDPPWSFTAIWAGADGPDVRVWWAVGKDEAAARKLLKKQRGVFVDGVTFSRAAGSVTVKWTTDEPCLGRVEYGAKTLDHRALESGTAKTDHALSFQVPVGACYFRVIAADAYGDETVEDNDGELHCARDDHR